MKHTFERYCKDYENIENYDKALKDNFKGWHCHHRLETHTSDGERRAVDITQKELIALNMYYHRPAEELIFLPRSEHEAFGKGKHHSEETKKKMSDSWDYDKHFSEETRRKMRKAKKGEKNPFYGKHHTEETRRKMREVRKGKNKGEKNPMYGKHWYNNGKINITAKECPEGFTPGMLR